jgi:hypothetical protein
MMNKGYAAFELGPRHVRSVNFELSERWDVGEVVLRVGNLGSDQKSLLTHI